jgi:hypothetical protein
MNMTFMAIAACRLKGGFQFPIQWEQLAMVTCRSTSEELSALPIISCVS